MLKKIKRYKLHILVFFIPFFLLLAFFIFRCYLRNTTIFVSDSYAQYFSFFSYLKDVFSCKQSLFYSLNSGFGSEMLGTYAYYLASPINFILIFFPKEHLDIFFMIAIVLKISLSSLFMYIYMNQRIKQNTWKIIFSLCYAFMAYNINYYFHIMWLDAVMLAPLLIYGIERLVKKDQGKLYGIILLLAIFSNYYIGIALCIFSCIYFSYYLFLEYHHQGKKYIFHKIKKFLIISILSGLSCALFILPSFIQLLNVERKLNISSNSITSILEFLSKGYIASQNYQYILNRHYVSWYTGIIILLLVFRYFMNHKISKKEKIASFSVILIFLLSFFIPILNIIWHGFSNPVCFNYRYSFLFSLFLILISSREIENQETLSKTKFLLFLLGYVIVSFILVFQKYTWNTYYLIDISVGLVILYECLIEFLNRLKNPKEIRLMKILFIILVCGELFFNIFFSFRKYEFSSLDDKNDLQYRTQVIKKNQDLFHRMEFTSPNTSNDAFISNYYGINTFNSMLSKDAIQFVSKFGFTSQSNSIYYQNSGTLISDSLLGISKKYGVEDPIEGYQKIGTYSCSTLSGLFYPLGKTTCQVIENKYALSLGYMIDQKSLQKIKDEQYDDVFKYQNLVLNSMTGQNLSYFKSYEATPISVNTYEYQLDQQDNIYLYMDFAQVNTESSSVKIYINDELYKTLTLINKGIQILPNNFKNQKVTVRFEVNGNVTIHSIPLLYFLDTKLVQKQLDELSKNQLQIKTIKNTVVEGSVEATKQKNILFLSIPYSEGWKIEVDGKPQKVLKLYETFLGVSLSSGKHHIKIAYHTPGWRIGIIISIISFLLWILYFKKEGKDIKK